MAVFLEVIEWFDETGHTMMHRIPEQGSAEIKFGAQLVVRESQAAIFFRDGKAYDETYHLQQRALRRRPRS